MGEKKKKIDDRLLITPSIVYLALTFTNDLRKVTYIYIPITLIVQDVD